MSLWEAEEKTAKALEGIDKKLDEHFNPAPPSTPPQCARMFSDTLREFLEGVRSANEIRQHVVKAAEPFKGSTGYDRLIEDADDKYHADVSGLQEDTKAAVKAAISLFRDLYEKNTMRSVPSDVMQQLQVFSMLVHPSADQYAKYQKIFQDYPSAMEVLCSKYDADMEPTSDGKPGYAPKNGVLPFAPNRGMSDAEVSAALDMLLRNAYSMIDGACSDNPGLVTAAQIRKAEQATNPVQMISAVNVDYDAKTERLLSAVDFEYRPSTKEESPEDVAEEEYRRDKAHRDMVEEAAARQPDPQKALEYYLK